MPRRSRACLARFLIVLRVISGCVTIRSAAFTMDIRLPSPRPRSGIDQIRDAKGLPRTRKTCSGMRQMHVIGRSGKVGPAGAVGIADRDVADDNGAQLEEFRIIVKVRAKAIR